MFDFLFILVIILIVFLGSKRGLIKSALYFFSFAISIIITTFLHPIINAMLTSNPKVVNSFSSTVERSINFDSILGANANIPSSILEENYLSLAKSLPKELQDLIGDVNALGMEEIFARTNTMKDVLVNYVAILLINIFSLILVFAVASFVIKLISSYISIVTANIGLGFLDPIGGGVISFVQIIVYIFIGIYVIRTFLPKDIFILVYDIAERSFIMSLFFKLMSA